MNATSTQRAAAGLVALLALGASGCVTVAEHRKLEADVRAMKRGSAGGGESVADLRAQLDAIERRLDKMDGRIDETQRTARQALDATQHAAANASVMEGTEPGTVVGAPIDESVSTHESTAAPAEVPSAPTETASATPSQAPAPAEGAAESGASVQEVSAYREAHASYRGGEYDSCIDRFRRFLQTYPTSPYADDAAYWMAECHFKKGDYKSAVLRFDDVVARYPEGDKSADALYRQGEALLKLGPNYAKAAGKAFERVIGEYPGSPRAAEAKQQLELLATSGASGAARPNEVDPVRDPVRVRTRG
jgi:tol-pal system protein YbgF